MEARAAVGSTDDSSLSEAVGAHLRRFLTESFPNLGFESGMVEAEWTGVLGFTPDGRPLCGPVPGRSNVIVAAGFCGHGMPQCFGVGKNVALSEPTVSAAKRISSQAYQPSSAVISRHQPSSDVIARHQPSHPIPSRPAPSHPPAPHEPVPFCLPWSCPASSHTYPPHVPPTRTPSTPMPQWLTISSAEELWIWTPSPGSTATYEAQRTWLVSSVKSDAGWRGGWRGGWRHGWRHGWRGGWRDRSLAA